MQEAFEFNFKQKVRIRQQMGFTFWHCQSLYCKGKGETTDHCVTSISAKPIQCDGKHWPECIESTHQTPSMSRISRGTVTLQ